jgi:hypothetical protein
LHWNGKNWQQVPSPSPKYGASLSGISGDWAVGYYLTRPLNTVSLILHWNGRRWQQAPSPNPGGRYGTRLAGISGDWAVGTYGGTNPPGISATLILQWNGRSWQQVPSPV